MKKLKLLFAWTITLLIVWINVSLYKTDQTNEDRTQSVTEQLNFLESELKFENLGLRMQQVFPEGFVFVNALYGLAWCELSIRNKANEAFDHQHALKEAKYAYDQLDSKRGKAVFNPDLTPAYGIFYCGWRNYHLGKLITIDQEKELSDLYYTAFQNQCNEIATAINETNQVYFESYWGHAWPADMFLAIASLKLHDQIFPPKYEQTIDNWLKGIRHYLDPNTGLLPHKIDVVTGDIIEGARGCSISLMLRLLYEIDSTFAIEQYELYKKHFVTTTLGLPSVREYPKGTFGWGDIDSGPAILGVSFSGSIVGLGTLPLMGDRHLGEELFKTIHAWGINVRLSETQFYLLGGLPMADAFIAWSRASIPNASQKINLHWFIPIKFHLISIMILILFWGVFFRRKWMSFIVKRKSSAS